jgi:VanZ family protein
MVPHGLDSFSRRIVLPCILLLLFVLFFYGGPNYYSTRHFKTIWNLGHIIFFALLPYYIVSQSKKDQRFFVHCIIAFALAFVLGGAIEVVQGESNRISDVGDLFRDMIGAIAGLFFLFPSKKIIPKTALRSFQIVTLLLIGSQMYPVFVAFSDEYRARNHFPVLSNFESPFEIQRWVGDSQFSVDSNVFRSGNHSLKVLLNADLYSGIALFYFPGDWEGYHSFQFSIYNPDTEMLSITCRIHDKKHVQGPELYEDRFNRKYVLRTGWNTITINMKDILLAPKGREMDIRHIMGVGFFATRLPHPRILYVDDVMLEKEVERGEIGVEMRKLG